MPERVKRNERLAAMGRILTGSPNRIFTLSQFGDLFASAKSTVSEDILILSELFSEWGLGQVSTVSGAAGGVRFRPIPDPARAREELERLSKRLCEPGRLLPGGYLYISDVICDPEAVDFMSAVIARDYYDSGVDFVLTMETKGIPLAMTTAQKLCVPLVIARRDSRVYEGSAVKISYASGAEGDKIETMALSRRAVKEGQRALIVDDFMKAGGTLKGMCDLMDEFNVTVVGVCVAIGTTQPEKKALNGVRALMEVGSLSPDGAHVYPTPWALGEKTENTKQNQLEETK